MTNKLRLIIAYCACIMMILSLLSLSFAGCGPIRTFSNPFFDYSIDYPRSWGIDVESLPFALFFHPKSYDYYMQVNIATVEAPKDLTIQEYAKDFLDSYFSPVVSDIKDYEEGSNAPSTWEWYQSFNCKATDGVEISIINYFKVESDLLYLCNVEWDRSKTDEMKANGTYDEMFGIVKSFRLTDE